MGTSGSTAAGKDESRLRPSTTQSSPQSNRIADNQPLPWNAHARQRSPPRGLIVPLDLSLHTAHHDPSDEVHVAVQNYRRGRTAGGVGVGAHSPRVVDRVEDFKGARVPGKRQANKICWKKKADKQTGLSLTQLETHAHTLTRPQSQTCATH